MENQVDPLSQLVDIQIPVTPSIWPPAPGWWFLALLILVVLIYVTTKAIKKINANKPRREFIAQLKAIAAQTADTRQAIDQIAALLKQYSIHRFGRQRISRLSGDNWIRFLDKQTRSGNGFSTGVGSALGESRYQRDSNVDIEALTAFLIAWDKGKA